MTRQKQETFVTISPYNIAWPVWYHAERAALKNSSINGRIMEIAHFGSTAVFGMYAKPIIDILVGLDQFTLSASEIHVLNQLGYTFIEKSSYCPRYYLQKRGERNFNLSLVQFSGDVWTACLAVRDYLRAHPDKKDQYSAVKLAAIFLGFRTIAAYSEYKRAFVSKLSQEASASALCPP